MAKKKSTEKSEPKKNVPQTPKVKKEFWEWFKGLSNTEKITLFSIVIGVLGGIISFIISIWPHEALPEFIIMNASCHPDSMLIVKASNSSAEVDKLLIVKIDGFIREANQPVEKGDDFYWNILLPELKLPESVTKEGIHQICFGFEPHKMSELQNINFDRTPPQRQITFDVTIPGEKKLLNAPNILNKIQVKQILQSNGYFDRFKNETALGVDNQFFFQTINRDNVVIDSSTGLVWQQFGSAKDMKYSEIDEYIKEINRQGFGGANDWRLPTLEEAMSLMEAKKFETNLFIDPIFDKTQKWIWTSDREGGSFCWIVSFVVGYCNSDDVNYSSLYVRLVR